MTEEVDRIAAKEELREVRDTMAKASANRDSEEAIAELVAESPELKAALEEGEPAYQVAREIIGARLDEGVSQAELARRMGTTRAAIVRLELMDETPDLQVAFAAARALGREADIRFTKPVDAPDHQASGD